MKDKTPNNDEDEVLLPFWLSKQPIDEKQIQEHWLRIKEKIADELSENDTDKSKDEDN
jgi:hypothetical protein